MVFLLQVSTVEAQISQQTYSLAYLPQGFVLQNISGIGFNRIARTTISEALISNPALYTDMENIAFGFSYQFETPIDTAWFAGMGHSRHRPELPQSISLIFPFGKVRIGIGANQLFNSQFDYGEVQGTLVWQPGGSWVSMNLHPKKYESIIQYSGGIAYKSNCIGEIGTMSIGLRYEHEELSNTMDYGADSTDNPSLLEEFDVNLKASNFSFGLTYTITDHFFPLLRLALFRENQIAFNGTMQVSNIETVLSGYVPQRTHFGILLKPSNRIILTGNFSLVDWEKTNAFNGKVANTNEISANIGYELNRTVTTTWGVFSTDHQRTVDTNIFGPYNMKATYFLFGVQYLSEHVEIDISIADSHLSSDDWRKQSIIKVGVGYKVD